MALIDILKLNEELDKMIAAQEVEIGKLNEETETSFASQYAEMYADLKTLNDFARDLNTHIYHIYAGTMPPKASGRCYWDTLYYHFGRRDIEVYGQTALGDTVQGYVIRETSLMCRESETILKYWKECKDKIHTDFEAACVKAIKEKAEKANAKYQAALERKEQLG